MAETLINVNQNQLNTETGSFVELIKSTQEGKEAITTALVNKGIDATSDQTLTSMAGGINQLLVSDIQVHKGTIAPNAPTTVMVWPADIIVENEYGRFFLKVTSNTNIRITNASDYCVSPTASNVNFNYKDFTINEGYLFNTDTYYHYSYPMSNLFYLSDDKTELWYLGKDKQSIYKYVIDYSSATQLQPTENITVTLDRTLTLSEAFTDFPSTYPMYQGGFGLYYVNTDAKKIILGHFATIYYSSSYSSGTAYAGATNNGTTNILYYVSYSSTSGDESNLVATQFTNENDLCAGTSCLFIENDKILTGATYNASYYPNSISYYGLIKVDWTNMSLRYYCRTSEKLNNFVNLYKLNNKSFFGSAIWSGSTSMVSYETLSLYHSFPEDEGSQDIFLFYPHTYKKPVFLSGYFSNLTGGAGCFAFYISEKDNKKYINGIANGSIWQINNNLEIVDAIPCYNRMVYTSAAPLSYNQSCCIYCPDKEKWIILQGNAYWAIDILENQLVGITYTSQNGIEHFLSPSSLYTDNSLLLQQPEVLVEDN